MTFTFEIRRNLLLRGFQTLFWFVTYITSSSFEYFKLWNLSIDKRKIKKKTRGRMGMVLFLWTQVEMCLCLAWQSSISFPHWSEPRPPLPCLVSHASLYQRTWLLLRWMDIVASDTHAPSSLMSHSDHGGLSSQDVLWPHIALFCVIF